MARFNYYFKVDMQGNPIPGSNIKSSKRPRKPRFKQFTPQAALCCDPELEPEEAVGHRVKYYVRLDENLLPISGTLRKWNRKPRSGGLWQEVTGIWCCVELTGINANPASVGIEIGETQEYTVTATYSNGTTIDVTADATYTSNDTDVVTMTDNIAEGIAVGTTTITITYGGFTVNPSIEVTDTP